MRLDRGRGPQRPSFQRSSPAARSPTRCQRWHTAIRHEGHTDYLNEGRLEHQLGDRVEEQRLTVSSRNPERCTPGHACSGAHHDGHPHPSGTGHPHHENDEGHHHEVVPHGDHVDCIHEGHLHQGHCDVRARAGLTLGRECAQTRSASARARPHGPHRLRERGIARRTSIRARRTAPGRLDHRGQQKRSAERFDLRCAARSPRVGTCLASPNSHALRPPAR